MALDTQSSSAPTSFLDDRAWRSLLRDIHAGQVLPVIGPELVTIETSEGKQAPLYSYLADRH